MRGRRAGKQAVSVSLFPFLAVLVCTMGALIVLLVLVVQQARVHAVAVRDQEAQQQVQAEELEELQLDRDDYVWRREVLETQREELKEKLGDSRLRLSHFEEHLRKLQRRWKKLQAQVERLAEAEQASREDSRASQEQLDRLRREIRAAEEELAKAREEAQKGPQSFAIIPYEGPRGTRRRPIYIECTQRGIILQPEGIVLGPEDFEGTSGPGNPLDAALRATREYLVQAGDVQARGEPYPLLLVRPGGTRAYSVARQAMKSWDDEFGYELVDGEMKLEFPQADPALERRLKQAVQEARERQTVLAAAMPSRFGRRGGGSGGTSQARAYTATRPAGAATDRHGGSGWDGDGVGDAYGERVEGLADGQRAAGERQGEWHGEGQGEGQSETQHDARGPRDTQSSDATQDGSAAGPGGPSDNGAAQGASPSPLAHSRGPDWGLPESSQRATGVTRPIRIACREDRLIIVPQGGERGRREIEVSGRLRSSIDDFVSAVWEHTEQWGLAVPGGYWKPVLKVEVAPGAEARFWELRRLLQDSGLEIQRKSP